MTLNQALIHAAGGLKFSSTSTQVSVPVSLALNGL